MPPLHAILSLAALLKLFLFASGIAWLPIVTGSWQRALAFGLLPFFFAEVMKVMLPRLQRAKLQRSI